MFKTMFKTIFKTVFKTMVNAMFKTIFENLFEKRKNIANKSMSFQKITDTKTRDFIVHEFLKIRQSIKQNFLSERAVDLKI